MAEDHRIARRAMWRGAEVGELSSQVWRRIQSMRLMSRSRADTRVEGRGSVAEGSLDLVILFKVRQCTISSAILFETSMWVIIRPRYR